MDDKYIYSDLTEDEIRECLERDEAERVAFEKAEKERKMKASMNACFKSYELTYGLD